MACNGDEFTFNCSRGKSFLNFHIMSDFYDDLLCILGFKKRDHSNFNSIDLLVCEILIFIIILLYRV